MLKVLWPEPEGEHEAEGLRRWNGVVGAVRLFESDERRWALLLERLAPGTQLWERPEVEATDVAIGLLRRLWRPVEPDHPFERLHDLAARWSESVGALFEKAGRPFEPDLAALAAAELSDLGSSQGDQFLLHRDFHGGNVLAARREPWLAIDPKPTVGEREYDAAWLVGDRGATLTPALARHRLDQLSRELGLDRERLRRWTVARYVIGGLWSYEFGGDGRWAITTARIYASRRGRDS